MATNIINKQPIPDKLASQNNILLVQPNGTISSFPLQLGRYKDHNITEVLVDISQLIIKENKIEQLLTHYTPTLIFQTEDTTKKITTTKHKENQLIFDITKDITSLRGRVSTIFALIEKNQEGNIPNEKEIFTSSAIEARISLSMADEFAKAQERQVVLTTEQSMLQKPQINFIWNKRDISLSGKEKILGYSKDAFITELFVTEDIIITKPKKTYIVFQNIAHPEEIYKQQFDINNCNLFLTNEITFQASRWKVSLVVLSNDDTQQMYSNIFVMDVIDNTLKNNPVVTVDFAPLVTEQGEELLAEDYFLANTYVLNLTGDEIQERLNSVPNKQDRLIAGRGILLDNNTKTISVITNQLEPATQINLGGVRIGQGINVTKDGVISVNIITNHNSLSGLDFESSGHTGFASEKQLNLLKENTIPTKLNLLDRTNLNNERSQQYIYIDDHGKSSSISVQDLVDLKIRTLNNDVIPTNVKVGDYMFKIINN